MFQKLKEFCVFTTKPSFDDLMCDGKNWNSSRGML
jgi:hypothetical protein